MILSHMLIRAFALVAGGMLVTLPSSVGAIDWEGIEGTDVVLFYPGQASWEWVLTKSDHSGGPDIRKGDHCMDCHEEEESIIGDLIVSGKKLEPTPVAGKRGSFELTVKTAHDGARLHVWLQWPDGGEGSGPKMDPKHQSKVTMMLGDDALKEAPRAGCWGSCHDDAIDMPSAPAGVEITKYLTGSRTKVTRQGGGENYKSAGDLEKLMADGAFLEFWQADLNPGAPAEAASGHILDRRHTDAQAAVAAEAELKDGTWTVVLSRDLKAGGPGRKNIEAGTTYVVGFAVHDAFAAHRFHHVSLEHTLSLDSGDADLVAKKQ
jgi:hypothetical protein